jgi:putative PIG3 family NAD(P)H quinone oxidoreductase
MATLPETMLAIDPSGPGGPEVLRPVERPIPRPVEGELLIRVEAAGVNRPDILQRLGKYPPPPGTSSIPGLEVSGRVAAVGPAMSAGWVGKRVCALVAGGGYAEYCTAPAGSCLNIPGPLTMVEGAALPETVFTVWSNLFQRGAAKRGETVLVHGGTSGIGTTAIQLGRMFGVNVIVTAGSDEKCAAAVEIGATHAINYRDHDYLDEIERLTEGKGVDIVLDMIGGDYLLRNLRCLAAEGRHVSIAAQRGATPELPLWEVMKRRLTLTGSTLRARSVEFKSALAIDIQRQVWPNMETGRFRPVIDSVFPLAEAAEAHRRMESSLHIGKIVLQVGEMP